MIADGNNLPHSFMFVFKGNISTLSQIHTPSPEGSERLQVTQRPVSLIPASGCDPSNMASLLLLIHEENAIGHPDTFTQAQGHQIRTCYNDMTLACHPSKAKTHREGLAVTGHHDTCC